MANVRIHATTKVRPVDRLEADREAMLPLASRPAYPSATVERRLADRVVRISYRGVRYSVDPFVLGRKRGTPVEVHVGTDWRLRISHESAVQELEETAYWFELLVESGSVEAADLGELMDEAHQLTAMLVTSVKAIKARRSSS